VRVGYETTDASIGNKHFFTQYWHPETLEIQQQKLVTFLENKVFFIKSWSHSQIFFKKNLERFDQCSTLKIDFENHNFEMFKEVAYNFCKSDGDTILQNNAYFH
jgi:hypothetical protein